MKPAAHQPGRRQFLFAVGGTAASLAIWPRFGFAASAVSDTRLLVVLLRGGLDGLHALQPYADPAYARLRGALAQARAVGAGQGEPHRLDGSFALHPALGFAAGLYARKQLLPVVAVAPPYRQRSHFEAQDCLENGTDKPGGSGSGWLNRCVGAVTGAEGLAIASVMPLMMRGAGEVTSWSPPLPQSVDPILLQRLQPLYAADPMLADSFERAVANADDMDTSTEGAGKGRGRGGGPLPQMTAAAAKFMSQANGPRIGFVEDSGWDTHGNQAGVLGRKLAELDAALKSFHDGAQAIWPNTVVAVVSEFGRTAAVNGTAGTDHGTGGLALLAGGAVGGGRIGGDWPGLGAGDLYEGRDLRATTDLRALFKGVLAEHLQVAGSAIEGKVFPDSRDVRALEGLVVA